MGMLPSRAPLLIVPIRDRRQGRRILTIRNCAISMLTIAVVFASISIYNQRRHAADGGYGRLFGTQVPANSDVSRKTDVVTEGPVADQGAPDPMLVAPAAREQLLVANTNTPAQATTTTIAPVTAPAPQVLASTAGRGTMIVGDADGVKIVKAPSTTTAPQPVLSGGIFKKQ
jgi:hypothetical protein